jgi:hypothetical protein
MRGTMWSLGTLQAASYGDQLFVLGLWSSISFEVLNGAQIERRFGVDATLRQFNDSASDNFIHCVFAISQAEPGAGVIECCRHRFGKFRIKRFVRGKDVST